jgi:hypothetical protein
MADTCEKCGRNADGAHFTFFYGKYVRTTSSLSKNTVTTKTHYQIAGSQWVFLCSTCQIADRRKQILFLACFSISLAIVWVGIACLVAIPNPLKDALRQSISDYFGAGGAGGCNLLLAVIYLVGSIVIIAALVQMVREISQRNKPYADPQSGVAASEENEGAGSRLAIRLREQALRRLGYSKFFTPSERSKLYSE